MMTGADIIWFAVAITSPFVIGAAAILWLLRK